MLGRLVIKDDGTMAMRLLEPQTDKGDPTGDVVLEGTQAEIWGKLKAAGWTWTSNGPFAPRHWRC